MGILFIILVIVLDILVGWWFYKKIIEPISRKQSPKDSEKTSGSRINFDNLVITIATVCIVFTFDSKIENDRLPLVRLFFLISIIGSLLSISLHYIQNLGLRIIEKIDMDKQTSEGDISIAHQVFWSMKSTLIIFIIQVLSLLSGIISLVYIGVRSL